jgi:menaquinone-dependent protoporphyrinogen IX oxidase
MRVAVVYFEKEKGKLAEIAESMARGIGDQGHDARVINGILDTNAKLSMFEYIVIGTAPISLFSKKLDESVGQFIKSSGVITGKRCYAFVQKKGFRPFRVLQELMKLVEKEGVILKTSDVVNSKEEAAYIGKKLHISR